MILEMLKKKFADRVIPFYEEHGISLVRILTDRGTEFCGKPDTHDYQLFLVLNDIDDSRTKTKSPQSNGICERFQKTALDAWFFKYNNGRPHQGKRCQGKTPVETFVANLPLAREKMWDMTAENSLTAAA